MRLVGMLWWFWYSTHHWVEAHRWIAGALALPEAAQPDRERAALLFAAGALGALRAKIADAQAQLEEAASIAAAIGDERLEAYASNYLGLVYAQQLRPEARECSGRAERWFRAHGEGYGLRLALLLIGLAELAERNFDRARALMEEAVAVARTGRQDRELAVSLQTLAAVYLDERNVPAAEAAIRESLEALCRDPSYLFICHGIDQLAVATADRAPARAARWMGAADAIRRQIGAVRFGSDDRHVRPVLTRLPQVLGERAYERASAAGGALTLDQVMAEVLAPEATDVPAPAATAVARAALEGERVSARPAAATPADLSIRTLGPCEVHVRGAPVEGWPYVKPKELLVFLLCHPAGRTRQEIGTALWPDAAPAQVRNSFHVTLHHLRKILGHADWVVMDAGRYRIAPDIAVWFDAAEFESRARRGLAAERARAVTDLHAALELYRDHFLNGEIAGSWRDEEQDRLRQLHGDAGVRLGELLEESGDLAGATAAYQRVTAHEPLHEAAHRGLLTCWTRAGHRARAVAHFTRYAAVLREQLGLDPEPELVALYEAIRNEPAAGG